MAEVPLTIAEYRDAYRSGLTPAEAVRLVFARIAAHDDPAIFIALRPEAEVEVEAARLDPADRERLPLWGVPVAIKDNIDVAGLPTSAACPAFAYRPEADASVVARLRAAGALVIGKTNLDQFATGLVGVRSPYGVPRNALRPELVPGGSSSGSAVAVASGLVPLALGTDTAGSGRVPAGLNGIVGLKPTLGSAPVRGLVPACLSLDCPSVFALNVEDAWAAFRVIAGFDAADPFSRPVPVGTPGPFPAGLRVGVPDAASLRFGGDEAAAASFAGSVCDLEALGATVRPVDLGPFYATAALLYDGPWVAERYAATRNTVEHDPDAMLPVTRGIIDKARAFSAADLFDAQYRLAALRRETAPVWDGIDVLLVPTFPRPRTLADLAADPIGPNSELGTYTNFVNLLDLCALAVPGRTRPDGLPSGVTLVAPAGGDARLVPIGVALQARSGMPMGATGRTPPPDLQTTAIAPAADDEIEIVAVGAHLSGLPLNGELTVLGGRLLRAVRTEPEYRLFALPGGPPHRPGLLRVEQGTGVSIDTEVWALPPEGFARFVAAIPAPLGIGTLRLADSTRPKGFLVEPEGVRGARDVSEYGGWRAFLAATSGD